MRGATRRTRRRRASTRRSFNPRSPCGERQRPTTPSSDKDEFQPTLPLRGATAQDAGADRPREVSTHAPLAGSDVEPFDGHVALSRFQPTLPLRGATPSGCTGRSASSCFNPRSPCGERPGFCVNGFSALLFQPTLPLRGATWRRVPAGARQGFNPRSPCGERRDGQGELVPSSWFQPTLPLRGATFRDVDQPRRSPVSTHAPLAGSDIARRYVDRELLVSTHAPLAGSDSGCSATCSLPWFQPTLPLRGATCVNVHLIFCCQSFNPRSPCGERRAALVVQRGRLWFQPTLPLRGATQVPVPGAGGKRVSTHAPLAGSDCLDVDAVRLGAWFQPTLPLRGATQHDRKITASCLFQPTLPLRGATVALGVLTSWVEFQPTLPLRGATEQLEGVTQINVFQPTLPLRGATRTSWSQCAPLCFNPRSPCGERRRSSPDRSASARFNPRSPCGERRSSDHGSFPVGRGFNPRSPCGERLLEMTLSPLAVPFQPTLPLRGATGLWLWWHVGNRVSTHAPLAGSDGYGRTSCRESPCFNPRSPCGERRRHHRTMSRWCGFQPTLPLRGATAADPRGAPLGVVSTHAPLAGSDYCSPCCASSAACFNPRSPCGERQHGGRNRRHT